MKIVRVGLIVLAVVIIAGTMVFFQQFLGMNKIPVSSVSANVPASVSSQWQDAVIRARRIIAPLLEHYPGLSIAVGYDDSIIWSEAFGYADIENKVPASTTTQFRAYSIAKPITAMAVLRLYEQGRLDLDAPASRYVTGLTGGIAAVIVRQLAGHLSGIRDYKSGEWLTLSTISCSTPAEALGTFIHDPLTAHPGSTFSYSSFNYVLLSAVIEVVSAEAFADYMKKTVLTPANMRSTFYDSGESGGKSTARFYEAGWLGRVSIARPVNNSCKFGAGALVTTAEDLVRFGNTLLAGHLLNTKTLAIAFTSMKTNSGEETGYGFGWGIGTDKTGRSYAAHSGGAIGGRSAIFVYPHERVVVALMANIEGDRLTDEAAEIARFFLNK